jgi:hypothetical protein
MHSLRRSAKLVWFAALAILVPTAWLGTLVILGLTACAREPMPQPRKVVDPSNIDGAMKTDDWDVAAVAYEYYGQGLDYNRAGLAPVFLVFKNKRNLAPTVLYEETRGITPSGEYLPYYIDEAHRLVYNSEAFRISAGQAARSGGVTAALGAGLGALLGTIGGGDNIWRGAIIGGAAGGVLGSAAGAGSQNDVGGDIRADLYRYAWTNNPSPPQYTKVGYLYFPGGLGVNRVGVTIRTGERIETYVLPVVGAAAVAK